MDTITEQRIENLRIDMNNVMKVGNFLIALFLFAGGVIGGYVALTNRITMLEMRTKAMEDFKTETKGDMADLKADVKQVLIILQNKQDRKQ